MTVESVSERFDQKENTSLVDCSAEHSWIASV